MATLDKISQNINGRTKPTANTKKAMDMISGDISKAYEEITNFSKFMLNDFGMEDIGKAANKAADKINVAKAHGLLNQRIKKKATETTTDNAKAFQEFTKQMDKLEADITKKLGAKGSELRKKLQIPSEKQGPGSKKTKVSLGEGLVHRARWELAMKHPTINKVVMAVEKSLKKTAAGLDTMRKGIAAQSTSGTVKGAAISAIKKGMIDIKNAADTVTTTTKNFFTKLQGIGVKDNILGSIASLTVKGVVKGRNIALEVRKAKRRAQYTSKKVINGKTRYFYD